MEAVSKKTVIRKPKIRDESEMMPAKTSAIDMAVKDLFIRPSFWSALTNTNFIIMYVLMVAGIIGYYFSYWYIMIYILIVYGLNAWRKADKEKERIQIAHRIPFFADALANSLSVGATLEQAFTQSSFYLKGNIKKEFNKLILKSSLGKDLGVLLKQLDAKFPRTGLRYLISLLQEYKELGIGISPLLKRVAQALTVKADAEEKIMTILSAGSSYARLSIGVFVLIFLSMSYLLKDQIILLLSPDLKPILFFLIVWTCIGVLIVMRMTSMAFARTFALRPYIKSFMENKEFSLDELFHFAGLDMTPIIHQTITYSPLLSGFLMAWITSWYNATPLVILIGFAFGAVLLYGVIKFILKGMVEDQLIETIETFPELLQVFVIGLNSGLNTYLSFKFAQDALKGVAPRILTSELARTIFAMECGEDQSKTWQRLARVLPFESIVDFCEIMVVAPMHGESIVGSITQMMNSYQSKKLTHIEKKATVLGQLVIPLIVLSFFPLFLFAIFAPLVLKIRGTFG